MTPEEIKALRLRLHLKQPAFARLLGVCMQTVCNLENGHYKPKAGTLNKLIKVRDENV